MAGRIIAYSVAHNGPLPKFFSRPLFDAIARGCSAAQPEVSDVPDESLRAKLEQVLIVVDI
jgi:hypothetical protein